MLTVIVIVKNEEKLIKTCLESVKWVDEIIVVDNGSTDQTVEISKKYTKNIIKIKTNDFSYLRNEAMKNASGDWVFYVDADERVLEPLKKEILEIIKSEEKSAYAVSRINIIFGEKVNFGPYKKDWMIRLLKRDKFETWVGQVHEYAKFSGNLGYTKNSLLHLTHRNLDQFMAKSLEWSRIDAQLRFNSNHPKMTKWRFIRIFITEIFEQCIKRKGFFGGTVGIIDSILQVFSFYITYVRLWELQRQKPLDEAYKEIDQNLIKKGFNFEK